MSTNPAAIGTRRIALLAPTSTALLRNYTGLIEAAVASRHGVLCLARDIASADAAQIAALGAQVRPWPRSTSRLAFWARREDLVALRKLLRDFHPHAFLAEGRDIIADALAAGRSARVARLIAVIPDLPDQADATATSDMPAAMRKALGPAHLALFHNPDDARFAKRSAMLPQGLPSAVIASGGIDLNSFPDLPLPPSDRGLRFLMAAPLCRAAGVLEYAEAAAAVIDALPGSRARLLLQPGPVREAVSLEDIAGLAPNLEVLASAGELRPELAACHVVVAPARSGPLSQTLLAALASGRPVIASDIPGFRQTVDERVNGCLVAANEPQGLADAMASFVRHPELLPSMARAARLKAERRYDARAVARELLAHLALS